MTVHHVMAKEIGHLFITFVSYNIVISNINPLVLSEFPNIQMSELQF